MSDQDNNQPTAPALTPVESLNQAARILCRKLVEIEQDPDLLSVFSIARAHGYKVTSKFWHEEHAALAKAALDYDEYLKRGDKKQPLAKEAEAVPETTSNVVPMPPPSCGSGI